MSSSIDWQTIQLTLPGLSSPINARYEYTAGNTTAGYTVNLPDGTSTLAHSVAEAYNINLQIIAGVFNKPNDPTLNPPSTLDDTDVNAVTTAMVNLYNLAQNGIVDDSGKKWYLNTEMASNLDLLAKTFISAGVAIPGVDGVAIPGVPGNGAPLEALNAWKDLSALSPVITDILRIGLDTFNTNRTLQGMIELEYVKTANELVENKLGDLEEQLGLTSSTLEVLASVQDIHNQINVTNKGDLNFDYLGNYGNNKKDYFNAYTAVASQHFGEQIGPIRGFDIPFYGATVQGYFSFAMGFGGTTIPIYVSTFRPILSNLSPTASSYINRLISLRASLNSQIARLDNTLTVTQKQGAGNIYSALIAVRDDLNKYFTDANNDPITATSPVQAKVNGLTNWLMDKYDEPDAGSAQGAIQANITKAITAAQSLNESQKQDVKNYLFVFEEYYKSASAILQKITQIVERMAQGIRS